MLCEISWITGLSVLLQIWIQHIFCQQVIWHVSGSSRVTDGSRNCEKHKHNIVSWMYRGVLNSLWLEAGGEGMGGKIYTCDAVAILFLSNFQAFNGFYFDWRQESREGDWHVVWSRTAVCNKSKTWRHDLLIVSASDFWRTVSPCNGVQKKKKKKDRIKDGSLPVNFLTGHS